MASCLLTTRRPRVCCGGDVVREGRRNSRVVRRTGGGGGGGGGGIHGGRDHGRGSEDSPAASRNAIADANLMSCPPHPGVAVSRRTRRRLRRTSSRPRRQGQPTGPRSARGPGTRQRETGPWQRTPSSGNLEVLASLFFLQNALAYVSLIWLLA